MGILGNPHVNARLNIWKLRAGEMAMWHEPGVVATSLTLTVECGKGVEVSRSRETLGSPLVSI